MGCCAPEAARIVRVACRKVGACFRGRRRANDGRRSGRAPTVQRGQATEHAAQQAVTGDSVGMRMRWFNGGRCQWRLGGRAGVDAGARLTEPRGGGSMGRICVGPRWPSVSRQGKIRDGRFAGRSKKPADIVGARASRRKPGRAPPAQDAGATIGRVGRAKMPIAAGHFPRRSRATSVERRVLCSVERRLRPRPAPGPSGALRARPAFPRHGLRST